MSTPAYSLVQLSSLHQLERLNAEAAARAKRERRRANEVKTKTIQRMQLQMTAPLDIGMEQSDLSLRGQVDIFDLEATEKGLRRKGGASALGDEDDGESSEEDGAVHDEDEGLDNEGDIHGKTGRGLMLNGRLPRGLIYARGLGTTSSMLGNAESRRS